MRALLALTLVATLTACAARPPVFNKPGGTSQELARAHSMCLSQAGYGNAGRTIATMGVHASIYTSCMEGEGWQQQR